MTRRLEQRPLGRTLRLLGSEGGAGGLSLGLLRPKERPSSRLKEMHFKVSESVSRTSRITAAADGGGDSRSSASSAAAVIVREW